MIAELMASLGGVTLTTIDVTSDASIPAIAAEQWGDLATICNKKLELVPSSP